MGHRHSIAHRAGAGNGPWAASPRLGAVPGLVHGFTLRAAGDFSAGPPPAWSGRVGARRVRFLRQVHGTRVVPPDEPGELPVADAWAGRPGPGVVLGVRTADCLAVVLVHPASGRVGLAHAGWRGAAEGIVPKTLKALGVPAEEVWAALGPAIGPCCYQVGEDVARAVGRGAHLTPWPEAQGRYRFDLPGFAAGQLAAAGVPTRQLDRVGGCTACRPERFFSYRREGTTGRLCAFVGWRVAPGAGR